MQEDKKLTLYQINEKEHTVNFVWGIKNAQLLTAGKRIKQYSFDDILIQLEEFREQLNVIENIRLQMMDYIEKDKSYLDELVNIVSDYVDDYRKNIFFVHYSGVLTTRYSKILKEVTMPKDYVVAWIKRKQIIEDARNKIQNFFDEFLSVINDDRNFDYHESDETLITMSDLKLAVIRGNGHNEVYHVPDDMLLNFFYEFSYTVYKLGFKVQECHFCHKHFLGTSDSICCERVQCQEQHQKLLSKQAREERKNTPYAHEVDNYHTYVRNLMKELRKAKINPVKLDEFEDEKERRKAIIKRKKKECMEFGLPLEELLDVIAEHREAMKQLADRYIEEL